MFDRTLIVCGYWCDPGRVYLGKHWVVLLWRGPERVCLW
jgi:hypothetical protein